MEWIGKALSMPQRFGGLRGLIVILTFVKVKETLLKLLGQKVMELFELLVSKVDIYIFRWYREELALENHVLYAMDSR